MANKMNTVKIDFDGKERRIQFTLNAMEQIHEDTGYNPFDEDFMENIQENLSPKIIKSMVHATLKDDDPEITRDYVGKVLTVYNMQTLAEKLTEAWNASMDVPEQGEASKKKPEDNQESQANQSQ